MPIKHAQAILALNACLLPINSELVSKATSLQNAPNICHLLATNLTSLIKSILPVINCSIKRVTLLISR